MATHKKLRSIVEMNVPHALKSLSKKVAEHFQTTHTDIQIASVNFHYPFYARIKRAKSNQYYPILYGRNNEIVFTGETHKNRNDVVKLLKMWFPEIEIKKNR